jgi:hypothetical protein
MDNCLKKKERRTLIAILLPTSIFVALVLLAKYDIFGMGELPYWIGYKGTKMILWIIDLFR